MNDVMVVTPHSSFRDNLIYDGIAPTAHGNISLSDAANVYCMKPDMIALYVVSRNVFISENYARNY
ncbi:hypothetical protein AB6G29_02535 [Providencia hangzhouensis]|uniref:hypothetical protein n=1 Tax=Providencia hangzhouensis TaxID=3031799 RepID=UPI0034DD65CF